MEITSMDISYNTNAVSKPQFEAHLKLYRGYVSKIGEIRHRLGANAERADANAVYSYYRELKKEESYCMDSIILHEEYFQNMSAKKKTPRKKTLEILNRQFGSYAEFLDDFTACCLSARGWCITAYEQRGKCVSNILCDAHDWGIIINSYPLIITDVYEHAYFLDYKTDKQAYVKAFIESIDWDVVENRVSRL